MIELYERIKNTREDLDIKQYKFAQILNLYPTTYTLYENGFRSIPIEILDKIAINLNVSIDYLLEKTNKKRYENSKVMNYHILVENIKKYRKINHYTQSDFCKLLNCSQQALSNYELGLRPIPVYIINEIASTLNLSVDFLLGKIEVNQEIKEVEYI